MQCNNKKIEQLKAKLLTRTFQKHPSRVAPSVHLFVFLVNSALILARVNTDDYQRREHSLVKPYYGNENIF